MDSVKVDMNLYEKQRASRFCVGLPFILLRWWLFCYATFYYVNLFNHSILIKVPFIIVHRLTVVRSDRFKHSKGVLLVFAVAKFLKPFY